MMKYSRMCGEDHIEKYDFKLTTKMPVHVKEYLLELKVQEIHKNYRDVADKSNQEAKLSKQSLH